MSFFLNQGASTKNFTQANRYILLFRCAIQVHNTDIFEYKEDVLAIKKLLHGNVEHSNLLLGLWQRHSSELV